MTARLPAPSVPDVCGSCDRDRPLWRIYGHDDFDHVHRCSACAQLAFAAAAPAADADNQEASAPAGILRAALGDLAGAANNREQELSRGLEALAELERRLRAAGG